MSGSGGDKTEQPTPKKLRDARKKGQVGSSKETVSAALIIALFVYLWVGASSYIEEIRLMVMIPPKFYNLEFIVALRLVLESLTSIFIFILAPIILLVISIGIMANVFQFGFLFTLEPLKPSLSKISPGKGFGKIFALKNLMEFIKSVLKITILGTLIFLATRDAISDLVILPNCGLQCTPPVFKGIIGVFLFYTAVAFIVIAAWDFWFQNKEHIKQLKMTKDEVKREYKEMEGDPLIKSKRKSLHQAMLEEDMVQNVKNSSVLVTNPTHIAVALKYNDEDKSLPRITAMAEGAIAERMMKIAEEHNIPVMQNIDLARGLFEEGNVNNMIPSKFIEPVAYVLQWVKAQKEKMNS